MYIINKYLLIGVLLLAICSIFQRCTTINAPIVIPTYIHIDSVHFNPIANYPNYNNTAQITAVWVYYNNNPVGEFDLPATIPVIATGAGVLAVAPAIAVNGLNSNMAVYPFYKWDTFTFNAQPGKTIAHIAKTTLYNSITLKNISNFHDNNTSFSKCDGTVPLSLIKDTALEFEPPYNPCGGIIMNNQGDSSIDSSNANNIFTIDSNARSAFVELNYKCNVPFYIGVQANLSTTISATPYYLAGIYPSSTWKKIYINVGSFANTYKATNYTLYIKTTLPAGQPSGTLLLDNIQLLSL